MIPSTSWAKPCPMRCRSTTRHHRAVDRRREVTVPVLGSGWDAYALPPVEIVAKEASAIRSPAHAGRGRAVRTCAPASLSNDEADAQAIRAEIERAALEVCRAYQVRDLARVDLVWDGAQRASWRWTCRPPWPNLRRSPSPAKPPVCRCPASSTNWSANMRGNRLRRERSMRFTGRRPAARLRVCSVGNETATES